MRSATSPLAWMPLPATARPRHRTPGPPMSKPPARPRPPTRRTSSWTAVPRGAGGRGADHRPGRADRGDRGLAEGRRARADAARGLPLPREDHALRPRAHPRARRARARRRGARALPGLRVAGRPHLRRVPAGPRGDHAGVRALLDGGRLARLGRHRARRARLRHQVLHQRGQLRPGRQQHAGVLHPGRHQVPRPGARAEAGPAPARSRRRPRRTTASGTSSR